MIHNMTGASVTALATGGSLDGLRTALLGEKLGSVKATINKHFLGYTVTATLRDNGWSRALAASAVPTFAEAENIARAFAARHGVSPAMVEVVSMCPYSHGRPATVVSIGA
jgi:hypothetical protein